MTLRAFIRQAEDLRLLDDQVCVRASEGGFSGALLLDYGTLHPPDQDGYHQPDKGLVIECPWRLENSTDVIVGSGDQSDIVESRVQTCVGRRVRQIEVHPPSYMACIRFDGDLALWIFPDDSSDYTTQSEYPRNPYFVAGRTTPMGWE